MRTSCVGIGVRAVGVIDVGEFIPGEPEPWSRTAARSAWRRPPLVAVPQPLMPFERSFPSCGIPSDQTGRALWRPLDRQSTSLNPPENLDALHLFHGQHQLLVWFHGPRRYRQNHSAVGLTDSLGYHKADRTPSQPRLSGVAIASVDAVSASANGEMASPSRCASAF